jgi:signal transduction histidine kinase
LLSLFADIFKGVGSGMDENSKLLLLIVDDEESILNMYEQVVDATLFNVYTAESAETAILLMKNIAVDIVLSDLRMVSDSGLDILKYIHTEKLQTKFIMQTGYATVNTAVEAMKFGAYDFIQKPVNLNYLAALLARVRERILTERENIQLKTDKLRLEELNEMKEKFIAITNHELRTPLTILKGYSDLLSIYLEDSQDKQLEDAVATISNTIADMDTVVSRMHNMTRFAKNKIPTLNETFDLNVLLLSLKQQFHIILRDRKQNCKFSFSNSGAFVTGDEKHIKKAISEVLQNAIKFTEDEGDISVVLRDNGSEYALEISDSGVGIEKSEQAKVFEIFYEVQNLLYHSTSDSKFMGSSLGIGLALVKDICQANNIRYELQSKPKQGTRFTFFFQKSSQ